MPLALAVDSRRRRGASSSGGCTTASRCCSTAPTTAIAPRRARRKPSIPAAKPIEAALARISDGFGAAARLRAQRFLPVLAPPWNRVRKDLLEEAAGDRHPRPEPYGAARERRARARPAAGQHARRHRRLAARDSASSASRGAWPGDQKACERRARRLAHAPRGARRSGVGVPRTTSDPARACAGSRQRKPSRILRRHMADLLTSATSRSISMSTPARSRRSTACRSAFRRAARWRWWANRARASRWSRRRS